MLASAAKYTESKWKKIQIKVKLNFVLIQNSKILVIFFCLQAKLQLFQEYRALFENFSGIHSFQLERLPKKFYNAAKQEKSLFLVRQSIRN